MIDRRIRNIIPAAVICFMFLSIYACEDSLADKESEPSDYSTIIPIQSPNGGEVWHEQTTQEIRWYTSGDIGGNDIYIGYSTDGGTTWNDVVDGNSNSWEETNNPPYTNYWDETANDGSYNWTLPNFSDTLEQCIIGIWSVANLSLYDASDNFFTITCDSNYYHILYPNGGEEFQMGTNRTIFWESGGDAGGHVRLYYSLYGGESWYEIIDGSSHDGAYTWSVPTIQGTNELCRVKIQDYYQTGWYDISDNNFMIADTVIVDFDMSFESGEDITGWIFGDWNIVCIEGVYDGDCSAFIYVPAGVGGKYPLSKTITTQGGIISFAYYRAGIYASLNFYSDADFILGESYNGDPGEWHYVEHYLSPGTHTITWEFETSWYGSIWIDAILFP